MNDENNHIMEQGLIIFLKKVEKVEKVLKIQYMDKILVQVMQENML